MRDRQWQICLAISLLSALVYGLLDLRTAFAGDWIVQDDARQHVFWLLRYVDTELFPNDLIADYFQSVAPWGYTSVYRLGIALGVDPFVLSRLIPIPVRIITAYYFFAWCRTIFPVTSGCLTATLLLNQSLWFDNDVISATPRAFLYPFFIAFLYYFNQQALIPCLLCLIGLSLFYPQMVFIAWGLFLLKLIRWRNLRLYIVPKIKERNFAIIGLAVGFLVLLPYALKTSDFAPVITRAEALSLPEFYPGGRTEFFQDTIWDYIIDKGRGVMIPTNLFNPLLILIASLFLPLLVKQSQTFPLVQKMTVKSKVLSDLLLVSLGMYFLAHLVLFKLHLPSRYTEYSLRIVVCIGTGITIAVLLDYCWRYGQQRYSLRRSKQLTTIAVIAIAVVTYSNFFDPVRPTGYIVGGNPQLYQYLKQQPKDIVVASLTQETDHLPSFTQRSVLVSREYAIPYQLGYYKPFRRKVRALIEAQYSSDLVKVQTFINQHNITHWLIEDRSFDVEYLTKNRWLRQFRGEYDQAIANLENNQTPLLLANKDLCAAFTTKEFTVIDTKCLISATNSK